MNGYVSESGILTFSDLGRIYYYHRSSGYWDLDLFVCWCKGNKEPFGLNEQSEWKGTNGAGG